MTTSLLLRCVGTIGALVLLPGAIAWRAETLVGAHRTEPDPQKAARLISTLDAAIQERFKEVDERFGIRRVIRVGETPHAFKPEDATELSAVKALEKADLRVVLYLSGRSGPEPRIDTARSNPGLTWRLVKGPVEITHAVDGSISAAAEPPPHPLDLWDDSRRALSAFSKTDLYEFQREAWRFMARPVRASDAGCLNCHDDSGTTMVPRASRSSTLRLGDPLGVVLYGYRARFLR